MQERWLLAGKYGIWRGLGRGGIGDVVAARHRQLDERVAGLQRARVVGGWCLVAVGGLAGCGRTALAPVENDAGVSGASPDGGLGAASGMGAETAGSAPSSGGAGLDAGMGAVMTGGASGTGGASPVVGCLSDADCAETTPSCNTTTNVCGPPPPSCIGLAWTCGPSGNAYCCASSVVTGGTFNRSNDSNYPATVSDFRLDTYEITVGRFRNFWSGYPGNMPASGSGKNPNNPSDRGWDATWNASALPASQAQLTAKISCPSPPYQTWTAGNDALPMNCIDWYEAEAFCIWDGGRLPTEAEWNYAAAGGAAQRAYPWGSAAPDCSYANIRGAAGGTDYCVPPGTGRANRVGSESPKGDGLYGQADLAGNVWEWAQDWYTSPYPNPCDNCAYDEVHFGRVLRGGSFYFYDASSLLSSYRSDPEPSARDLDVGARCARAR